MSVAHPKSNRRFAWTPIWMPLPRHCMSVPMTCSTDVPHFSGGLSRRLRLLRVGAVGKAEEVEYLLLLGGEFWLEGLHEVVLVVEVVAGQGAEDLQHPLGGGCLAVAELGVELDGVQRRTGHTGADFAFDEGGDEQGEELAAEQGLDAGGAAA